MTLRIASDLATGLSMYTIPRESLRYITSSYDVSIEFMNCIGLESYVDAEIFWGNRITNEIAEYMLSLKWIHFGSSGTDKITTSFASERSLIVTSSRGLLTEPVALYTVGMIISLVRGHFRLYELYLHRNLSRETYDVDFEGIGTLINKIIVLVGAGLISLRIAEMLTSLGAKIILVSQRTDISEYEVYPRSRIKDAVRLADYIVNALSADESTLNIFDRDIFVNCRSCAFFINIGRSSTVCEDSLYNALQTKQIAGAVLDVFANEKRLDDSPLRDFGNVVLTPHIAAVDCNYWPKEIELFTSNLGFYLDGNFDRMINVALQG